METKITESITNNECNPTNQIFENLNIYVEIINNNIDQSDLLDEVLTSNGANVNF
jgi:hypothetical protein